MRLSNNVDGQYVDVRCSPTVVARLARSREWVPVTSLVDDDNGAAWTA
jgi:hypothetical protein